MVWHVPHGPVTAAHNELGKNKAILIQTRNRKISSIFLIIHLPLPCGDIS
jgi:hypothetical protein